MERHADSVSSSVQQLRCFSLKYLCLYNQLPLSSIKISRRIPGSEVTVHLPIVKFHRPSSSPSLWFIHTLRAPVPLACLASFPTRQRHISYKQWNSKYIRPGSRPQAVKRTWWRLVSPLREAKELRSLVVINQEKIIQGKFKWKEKEKARRGQMNGADDSHTNLLWEENKK